VICASPGYLEARGEPQTPQAVTDHACISSTPLSAPVWSFQVGGDKVAVVVKSRLHVSTSEAAIDAAIAGLGLTRALCYQIAGPRKAGRLKVILEQFEPEAYPISLVYAAQGMLPIKVRSFLDFATPRLRKFADT
jgi:DNA-binding transcriptional LysR family regulator